MIEDFVASLPYNGSSGWSGSQASKRRADNADNSGLTGKLQKATLVHVYNAGVRGLTGKELGVKINRLHQSYSAILSNLHKDEHIARLADVYKRNGESVYVAPTFVNGRETQKQGRNKRCPHCGGSL